MIRETAFSYPTIMGIVNVTPDSFSDGGHHATSELAIIHAMRLIEEGADILDIGGESTRPGAKLITLEEELHRVLPVIRALRQLPIKISVDTRHHEVMQRALDLGVHMINDINALQDKEALRCCVRSEAEVCIMHMQGTPQTMQHHPHYETVVREVYDFLEARVKALMAAGIHTDRICIDPGFGFGKTVDHNLQLMRQLTLFKEMGCRLLIGISRKNFLGQVTQTSVTERLVPSVIGALWASLKGADILRVHDVRETRQALVLWQAMAEGVE